MRLIASVIVTLAAIGGVSLAAAQAPAVLSQVQNPSPMVENTHAHAHLAPKELGGDKRSFVVPGGMRVEVWLAAVSVQSVSRIEAVRRPRGVSVSDGMRMGSPRSVMVRWRSLR